MLGSWRDGFEYAWQAPDPEPDEGPGLTWRETGTNYWSGTWDSKIRGTVTRDSEGWVAYLRLEDPPGLSPITTVGRFATVEAAQVATDEVWASRRRMTVQSGRYGAVFRRRPAPRGRLRRKSVQRSRRMTGRLG